MLILWLIIILLLLIISGLVFAILYMIKKATYLTKNEKQYLDFAVDIYINYAEELNIVVEDKHEKIVQELEKIRKKHFI